MHGPFSFVLRLSALTTPRSDFSTSLIQYDVP